MGKTEVDGERNRKREVQGESKRSWWKEKVGGEKSMKEKGEERIVWKLEAQEKNMTERKRNRKKGACVVAAKTIACTELVCLLSVSPPSVNRLNVTDPVWKNC